MATTFPAQPQLDLQTVQLLDKYSRWRDDQQRRETWEEVCERVMGWVEKATEAKTAGKVDFPRLHQAMLDKQVLPSMRMVQMAGKALDRCHVGAYNCAFLPLDSPTAFAELLYILMQGTGVGFSVESHYVNQWPQVGEMDTSSAPIPFIIADTTEGWCDALKIGLTTWLAGGDVKYDYSRIRPYGSALKTKGGTASGPEPLENLLNFARTLIQRHAGRRLSSLNLHDLACYCGSIVQVGGVRRAAEISLSDVTDQRLAHAKMGRFYEHYPERAMANNSAVYTSKPSMEEWFQQWQTVMASGTGERGIFNRESVTTTMPARRNRDMETKWGHKPILWGSNPCGEIVLRPMQFCNLSIAVARPEDTLDTMKEKVTLATQWGIVQSLLTEFKYLRPQWAINCREERLLGVDITGQMDCALFTDERRRGYYYAVLKAKAVRVAEQLSRDLSIPMPAAVTCVKPSGNSSQLLGCSSGIHPRYAPYYIRRLRIGGGSPISRLLREAGVPHHPEVGQPPVNPSVWVFEFPVQSPHGAVTRHNRTALQQLDQWLSCKRYYTEHNPSCTIYVQPHEWMAVGAWVYEHWAYVGGLSFLPYDGGTYMLAPYEEIDQATYEGLVAKWPQVDFTKLTTLESTDTTTVNQEYACQGGSCDL